MLKLNMIIFRPFQQKYYVTELVTVTKWPPSTSF